MSDQQVALPEVPVRRQDMQLMERFVRCVWELAEQAEYHAFVQAHSPPGAMLASPSDAILMGFDFHLTEQGPRLIEINNNAGGLFSNGWLPQPGRDHGSWPGSLTRMFPRHWRHIAIIDEDIEQQRMYPEMRAYAELLRAQGRKVVLASPQALRREGNGLYIDGLRLDGIYNRHADFYLQHSSMHLIREALMHGLVEVNPYPRSYALLGDKARMADWWQSGLLEQWLPREHCRFIRELVPETRWMCAFSDDQELWKQRRQWVFKPPRGHAGKGVLPGKGMSRRRFSTLDRQKTLVQRHVPAGEVLSPDGRVFRLEVRLYLHGARVVALGGRLWRGQVANFREPGSGWTAIRVVD